MAGSESKHSMSIDGEVKSAAFCLRVENVLQIQSSWLRRAVNISVECCLGWKCRVGGPKKTKEEIDGYTERGRGVNCCEKRTQRKWLDGSM